jgi:WD40 repeat protein
LDGIFVTGSDDGTAKLWQMSHNKLSVTCLETFEGNGYSVNSVAFHPTKPVVLTFGSIKPVVRMKFCIDTLSLQPEDQEPNYDLYLTIII